jgi:hypothetical protein
MVEKTPPPGDSGGPSGASEILLCTTPDQQTRIEVRLEGDTVWLTQRQMAELFQKSVPTINEHIRNVFAEGELEPPSDRGDFRMVSLQNAELTPAVRRSPFSLTSHGPWSSIPEVEIPFCDPYRK